MKKNKLLKSLLVAVSLLVGASAWADATTIYERGTTTAWSNADLTDWVLDGTAESSIVSTGLKFAKTATARTEYTYTKSLSTSESAVVSMNLAWNVENANGSATAGCYFILGDVKLFWCGQNRDLKITIGGTETTLISGGATSLRGTTFNVGLSINKTTKAVAYSISNTAYNSGTAIEGNGYANTSDVTSIAFGWARGGQQNTSSQIIKSINITEEVKTETTANYTVKFLCGETAVKDESIRTGVVGDPIVLTAADKTDVIKDGNKYVYESDDSEGKTVTTEGTVVTVNFVEAAKYTYTLNAVDGDNNFLKELGSGEQFVGEDATIYFNKAIFVNGKWYITNYTGNWVFHEAKTENILFTEDASISYFFEVEDINKSRDWAADGAYKDLYSNGRAVRFYKGAYAYTDPLEGGVYTVTLWGRNNNSNHEAPMGVYVRDAEGNETKCHNQFANWGTGAREAKSIMIEIPDGYSLELKNEDPDNNSNLEMDYLILRKSGINTMSIVGFTPESGLSDTEKWNPANGIAMTRDADNPAIWTAVVENYIITGSNDYELKYYYKAAANSSFEGYQLPASGNQNYNFNHAEAGAGKYKLTFTANTFANTVELAIEKQVTGQVYFVNTADWTDVKIWVWDSNNSNYNYTGNNWPGHSMAATGEQQDGHDVYTWSTYDITGTPTTLIISNNGSDTERTGDQAFVNGATYKADGSSTVTKTITTAGYATFCCSRAVDFTGTGLTAYIAKKDNNNKVTFTPVAKVPANTGVLLKGEAGKYTINSTYSEELDDVTDNVLVGVTVDTQVPVNSFVLMNGTSGVGFYKTTKEFTVGANTAYIEALPTEARFIGFDFEDNTTTAIEGIATVKVNNGEIYNLQGQRVLNATKGLFIVNGKKVVIK